MSAVTAKASIVVDRPREQVWHALTDPDLVSKYFMGATVKTDWQVGHPITFTGTWKDKPFEDKGEILDFKPEKEMTYSHWSPLSGKDDKPDNYHVVHIALDDAEGRHQGHARTVEPQRRRHRRGPQEPRRVREELGRHVARLEEGRRSLTGAGYSEGRMRNFWPVAWRA